MRRFALFVLAGVGLVAVLVASSLAVLWLESDDILRWRGYAPAHSRLVTGLLVVGTAARPVIYVTSSDPRFGSTASDETGSADTNSGVLSRLTPLRGAWLRTDLVRGLPRSKADHATNGVALAPDGTTLYVAQGGNTNEGAPSRAFGFVPEYALSGAILAVDLARIGDRTYDLPTLDDPRRPGATDDGDPFGGDLGRNQAVLAADGPVRLFATGLRNPYDIAVDSAGRVYTVQNGPNSGYGGPVRALPDGMCTNLRREGGHTGVDTLHLVVRGMYYGHPNPGRAECTFVQPNRRVALARFTSSTNGLALRGRRELITASLEGAVTRLRLAPGTPRIATRHVLARLTLPLDVTTQGSGQPFPGTIWVARYTSDASESRSIVVLEPRASARRGWHQLPGTGEPRQEVSFVQAGGKLYLAGGGTRHQVYDPTTRTWRDLAPLPADLDHIQGIAIGRRIYYVGGLREWPAPNASSVYVYDTATDRFSLGARMPRGRGAGGVGTYRGKILYAGGLHDGKAVPWLDLYDPAADAWSTLPDMPRARDHFQAVVVNGKLYAIGGRQGPLGSELAATDVYDIKSRNWQEGGLALLPTPRGGFAAAALGGRIFVIGGEAEDGALRTVEEYDIRADRWRVRDPMPTARHGIQAAVCQGGIFVAAGGATAGGNDPLTALESYTPGSRPACGAGRVASRAGFTRSSLAGTKLDKPTALQFGPDGRLYVSQQDGRIVAFTVVRTGTGRYRAAATETLDAIKAIPNHNDDGSSATDFNAALHVLWEKVEP